MSSYSSSSSSSSIVPHDSIKTDDESLSTGVVVGVGLGKVGMGGLGGFEGELNVLVAIGCDEDPTLRILVLILVAKEEPKDRNRNILASGQSKSIYALRDR